MEESSMLILNRADIEVLREGALYRRYMDHDTAAACHHLRHELPIEPHCGQQVQSKLPQATLWQRRPL